MKTSYACAALFVALCTATALSNQLPVTIATTQKVGEFDVEYNWNYTIDTETQTASFDSVTPHPFGAITLADVISDGTHIYAVTKISPLALANARALTSVTIPRTCEEIGAYAFSNCTALASVSIAEGVRYIGARAFVNTAITQIELPNTLLDMGGNVSAGTLYTTTISIGDSSHFAFSEDGALYNRDMTKLYACPPRAEGTIAIPDTTTNICQDAFFGCFRLAYLNLPKNISVIGPGAFNVSGIWPGLSASESTPKLNTVFYSGDRPNAADDIYDGAPADLTSCGLTDDWSGLVAWKGRAVRPIDNTNPPLFAYRDSSGITWHYRIVDGVAEIYRAGQTAVSSENPILSINLPATLGGYVVKGLGTRALAGLRGITSVAIPDTYDWIGDFVFDDCTSLSSIELGSGLKSMGKAPFRGTSVQTLDIPATLTALDGNPLAGASQATGVSVSEDNPAFSAVDGILYDRRQRTLLACPAAKTEIDLPDTIAALAADALDGCNRLDELRATVDAVTWRFMCEGQGVTIYGANSTTSVIEIPAELCALPVTKVADGAFNDCSGVTAFRSQAAAVASRNGCLYSADGKELIRVPDTYVFPYDVVTATTTASTSTTTIPALNGDGTDATRTTVTTNAAETTTSRNRVIGNASFKNVLSGVTKIRDYAFYGCNAFTNTCETVTNSTFGTTGLVTSDDGTKVPFVKSVTSVVVTETAYATACPLAATVDVASNAFAGSAIAAADTSAADPDKGDPAPTLAENTSYIGWTTATDRTTGTPVMTGILTAKIGRLQKGALKVTGSYTPLGGKKQRLTSVENLLALPGLILAKDLSKSRYAAEKASFDHLRGKLWTIALDARATDSDPLHGGLSGLSLAVGQKGKVKVSGFLADGTPVGVRAQTVMLDDGYAIPVLAQLYPGRRGGFAALVRIDANGNLTSCTMSPLTIKVNGGFRTLLFDCVATGAAGEIHGGIPVIDMALDDVGYSLDSSATGWRLRYTARTGLFKGTVNLRDAGGRRVRATFYAVSVNGIGYGAALVKKVGSWPALVVAP